ncbi:hypothetical protein [Methylobacter sp. YRD-M1]|uniref:hypothetical protein n=1 Tax=Methylobacter sp. YRD-M1 TaxID=2911520 RepID=UPI00227BC93D|nr:hypothetical protein [Methylobacter sp. YRD-M1]WAK04247.1 hypothetical protein LZ558_13700 [Methylobacter sp. YRD-M1]
MIKAKPLCNGKLEQNASNACNPPAEAPIPITGNKELTKCFLCCTSWTLDLDVTFGSTLLLPDFTE